MRRIEILAPAASFEGLKAVINAGADAIYLGGKKFGARAYADNFDEDSLIKGIKYAHLYNVKVHLTINTLVKENEIEDLYNYILPYYRAGIDAVIVQDIGVMAFIQKYFPNVEIHMSTQTTITSSQCIDIIKRYHVKRIVLARELSIEEIEEIKRTTGVEVETFIHGALCYSYSGQCLLSSMIGERSGNRGRCAQPCRKKYRLYKDNVAVSDEKYLLSPKDMCGLKNLHNLINIGVDSLKIEGRMKKVEYAATIVSIYRKYVDKFYELGYGEYVKYIKTHGDEVTRDILKMQDVYNRGGFTSGYFDKHNSKNMMAVNLPSHQGVLVGKVINVSKRNCTIHFSDDVNGQDVLLIRKENDFNENNSYEFTLKDGYKKDERYIANYSKGIYLEKGYNVYRIKNNCLLDSIRSKYIESDKKVDIRFNIELIKNKPCKVSVLFYDKEFVYEFDKVGEAINRPISKDNVIKQFSKIKDTCFSLAEIKVDMDDDIFIPIKMLNEYRRNVLESIIEDYNNSIINNREVVEFIKDIKNIQNSETNNKSFIEKINVLVNNNIQLNVVLEYENIKNIYLEMESFKKEDLKKAISLIKLNNKKVYIAMPRIIRSKHMDMLITNYKEIFLNTGVDGYLVRNVEGLKLIKEYTNSNNVNIIGDINLYITNNCAKEAWKGLGITQGTISCELSKDEIELLDTKDMQLIIYGRLVVMISANCVKKTNDLCNLRNEDLTLKDSYGEKYVVKNICNYCYNVIYNSKPINIINDVKSNDICGSYRIDFVNENRERVIEVLNSLDMNNNLRDEFKGHFDRKTL